MLAAATKLENAERVRRHLVSKNALHPEYGVVKELDFIYFPLAKRLSVPLAKVIEASFSFPRKEKPQTVEQLLSGNLTPWEKKQLPRAQEIVGTILILEIPEALQIKEMAIAKAYLMVNKHITTVVKKKEMHEGTYRLRKVTVLAGARTKETIHHENGISLKLDLEKTYFSARLAHERLRLAKLVEKKEKVLVMFSGAAPYPVVIAKHSAAAQITGIEINPLAHQYAVENVHLNKSEKRISLICGDVRRIMPQHRWKFDRIIMPLPKTGEQFLDVALPAVKPDGFLHLYTFLREEDRGTYQKHIQEICRKAGYAVRIGRGVTCGQFSPAVQRMCFDMKVIRRERKR